MPRLLASLFTMLAFATASQAHFVFVIVDARDAQKALVVFSDELAPDENVDIAKVAGIKLSLRDAAGKDSPLTAVKAEHALAVKLPGKGQRTVFGSVDYGVLQRGEGKPFMLRYHPKSILGPVQSIKIGDKLPIEVVPVVSGSKVRFQVLVKGKPLADAEVNLMGDNKEKLTTDKEGLTSAVEAKGKIGLWTKSSTTGSGEFGGKKYEEARDYATLVVDFDAK